MKKLLILATFLLVSAFSVNAQTKTDSLQGNWKFKDVYESEKQNSDLVAMIREMFADMKVDFNADKKYKFHLMEETELGTWTYDIPSKSILLKSDKGIDQKLEVLGVTGNLLHVSLAKGKSFTLEKAAAKK